nr:formin-like protein 5 [Macaca nemestrina]
MAGASAARAAPSPILPPPPDLAPPRPSAARRHCCPPPSPPGRPLPPLPLSGGRAFLLTTHPPPLRSASSPSPAHRTGPATEPRLWPRHRGRAAEGLERTQQAARVAVSRALAGTVAAAAGLGARRARRLHLRGQIGVRRVAGTPEARGRGDGCSLGRVSAGSNPGKGKQRHGTSAHWMRIHLPLELGIDFVKDIM